MLTLALTMTMYIVAASHWALNISILVTKLRSPALVEHDLKAKSFALAFLLGTNVSLYDNNNYALTHYFIVDNSKRYYSNPEIACIMGA
jgi:hypothetical protein